MKLNIGCGKNICNDFINLDKVPFNDSVVQYDLEDFPYPFPDNHFDEIRAWHILEHLSDLQQAMDELHRVCKPNAVLDIRVPYFSSQGAFNNPEHKRFFTWRTFEYFPKFKIEKRRLHFRSIPKGKTPIVDDLINLKPMLYQRLFCWIFPIAELEVKLIAIKKQ